MSTSRDSLGGAEHGSINQGGRSSRPLSTVHPGWRAKLRRLDRRCALAQQLMSLRKAIGWDYAVVERIYRQADMERMMIRNKIKEPQQ